MTTVSDADPAFDRTRSSILNSNLVSSPQNDVLPTTDEAVQEKLERARGFRRSHEFELAAQELVQLITDRVPDRFRKTAFLELAITAQEAGQLPRAQQIFNQFLKRYPDDVNQAEVNLRQGLIYREMGANSLAIEKFFAVMTLALNIKSERIEDYQMLVLIAQTQVADTFFLQGKYADAADKYRRLLKQDSEYLSKPVIQHKLVQCLAYTPSQASHSELVALAQDYLRRYTGDVREAEVRFLLASSLKAMGRTRDSLREVSALLESQQAASATNQTEEVQRTWAYWQQRTGNEIANQLFQEGDYSSALEVYMGLASLTDDIVRQAPVLYQIGLVYERLGAPAKAIETYRRILDQEPKLRAAESPVLKAILDMTLWRRDFLGWSTKAERDRQEVLGSVRVPQAKPPPVASALPAAKPVAR